MLIAGGTAAVHFVVTWVSLLSLLFSVAGPGTKLGVALGSLFWIFGFPATLVIGRWTPGILELRDDIFFSVMLGNSLVWGAALGLIWRWWRLRRTKRAGEAPLRS